jgi:hypothetical protein
MTKNDREQLRRGPVGSRVTVIATQAQVRTRLAEEGPFMLDVRKGERAWDPISSSGWTRGAGRINYLAPSSCGFVSAAWLRDSGRGSDLHSYDYDRRRGVRYA